LLERIFFFFFLVKSRFNRGGAFSFRLWTPVFYSVVLIDRHALPCTARSALPRLNKPLSHSANLPFSRRHDITHKWKEMVKKANMAKFLKHLEKNNAV
jgi:hypothetical protein